jgi:spermidine synthase
MKRLFSLLLVLTAFGPAKCLHASKTLYEKQSPYHYIRVLESGSIRTMTFRRKGTDRNQSRMDMADPLRPCLPYYPLMFAGNLFVPKPQRVLIVGLGAGILSQYSAHYFPDVTVDNIELDPDVVDVAKKFFNFQEGDRQRVFIRDARVQVKVLQREGAEYDIIMLDAFRGGYTPFQLTTREFYEQCRNILSPNGAIVLNLKPGWVMYQYQRRTLAAVFPEQYPFGGASGSEVIVAPLTKRQLTKEQLLAAARELQQERKFSFDLPDVVAQFDVGPGFPQKGPILTDDHAPANLLKQQMENPTGTPQATMTPFARIAGWFRTHRIPVIAFSSVVILAVLVLRRMRRVPSEKTAPPGASKTLPT